MASPKVETPIRPTTAPTPGSKVINPAVKLGVIVDKLSSPLTREQAQAIINEASKLLRQLAPFSLEMTDFVEDGNGGSTKDMAGRYIASHATALPNGIVIFSVGDSGQAKLQGGYSYGMAAPAGFRNAFVSPIMGANQIYVAVLDSKFRYAECGYGGTDTVQSTTSLNGECRNQRGTPCVEQNGYSMCSNAVGNLYMSTPTYYVSSILIYELMRPFAPGGKQDDYNTPECNAQMGYPTGFFDLQEGQFHNGVCPFVYENFVKSFQP